MALTNPSRNIWDVQSVSSAVEMIAVKKNRGSLNSISINNQHASTEAVVSLFLDDGLGNANSDVFIVGPISIPSGVTLVLEDNVSFDNDIYSLKITNTGGLPLSIIAR